MNNWKPSLINRFSPFFLILTALLFFGLSSQISYAEPRPQVAKRIIGYEGDLGIRVWTLRIGERKAQEALVQIEDVDHD